MKKIISELDFRSKESAKQSKGEKAEALRNSRVPPKLKRPFIGSKN